MAGEPQRVALSIQCWHRGTLAIPILSPAAAIECDGRLGGGRCFSFPLAPGPPPSFCKSFRIMDFAVFSSQTPLSKAVTCVAPLNHLLTGQRFHMREFGAAGLWSLVLGNHGMIWRRAKGQMSQWGCGKPTGGFALRLGRPGRPV